MDQADKNKIGFALMLLLPVISWFAVIFLTVDIPRPRYRYLFKLLQMTPEVPLWMAAPIVGFIVGFVIFILFLKSDRYGFAGVPFKKYYRGSRLVSRKELSRLTAQKVSRQINVAGIPMPLQAESEHLLVCGTTGTGKSVLLRELAFSAMLRGDKMIIVDPNGDMYSKFGAEKDIVLNPFDERSVGWSFFNEIRHEYDFTRFAKSLVPGGSTAEAEEWAGYARVLTTEVAKKLYMENKASIRAVYDWATIKPSKELKKFLKHTDGESLFGGEDESSRALQSTRFVLSKHLKQHISMPAGNFSIRDWLADEDAGNLYITWREDMKDEIRSLISTWVDVVCTSILSMEEDADRRIWLMIDELASMEKLPSLEDGLTKGRKHGLRVVAGLQSTSQLNHLYGKDSAQNIRSCFKSLVVLGGSKTDPQTNKDMSESLGDHEVERKRVSTNSGNRKSTSRSTERVSERIVMPSELSSLPRLHAYIGFGDHYPVTKTAFDVRQFKQQRPGFIQKV